MTANMTHETSSEITANDLAQKLGKGVDGIRIKYSQLFAESHPLFVAKFDRHAPLSPEQIEILSPAKRGMENSRTHKAGTSAQGVEKSAPALFASSDWTWQTWVFVVGAFLLVIAHAGLIWYDMAMLWKMAGKIGGGVVFAFIFIGMILMSEKRPQMASVRENMLWAVGALEAAAIVVHRGAFYREASEAYAAGMGEVYTWALASVICLCSIGATIFYQRVIQ